MNTALLIGIIAFTLRASSPLIYAAMAGILCERSGVVNIALEGMMARASPFAAGTDSPTG